MKKPHRFRIGVLRKNRRGETLAAIIVGSLVLAAAVSGVAVILAGNASLETEYERSNQVFILQSNAEAIIRRLDTSAIREGEIFYVRKDVENRRFLVLTGSENADYRYVNANGEWVNTGSTTETVFSRIFLMERKDSSVGAGGEVIRAAVKELIRK